MGALVLLLSVVFMAVGTWNWIRLVKEKKVRKRWSKPFYGGMVILGAAMFFLLKVFSE